MDASTARWPTPSTQTDSDAGDSHSVNKRASFWRSVGSLTSLGWMIALPIGGGVLLGRILDDHLASGSFWTLSLLGAGVGLGILQLISAARNALERIHDE